MNKVSNTKHIKIYLLFKNKGFKDSEYNLFWGLPETRYAFNSVYSLGIYIALNDSQTAF